MRRRYRFVRYGDVRLFTTQDEAASYAHQRGLGITMAGRAPKMLSMVCPCGCGEMLKINLMAQMGRYWRTRFDAKGRLTLWPSVDLVGGCRSHFFLAANNARLVYDL